MFRRAASDASTLARWVRIGEVKEPDPPNRFVLAEGETATFEASRSFPLAGTWEAVLDVVGSDGAVATRFVLAMTRTPASLPRDFLVEPRMSRIDLAFPNITTPEGHRITLIGRNTASEPVEVSAVDVGRLARIVAQAKLAVAPAVLPKAEGGCLGKRPPQTDCPVVLTVPDGLEPVRYAIDVVATGPGGQSVRNQTVDVRASAVGAGGLVGFGALLGSLVDRWRTSTRAVVDTLIDIAERRHRYRMLILSAMLPAARRALHHLITMLDMLNAQARHRTAVDLKPYDERFAVSGAALLAHEAAERIPDHPGVLLMRLRGELADAMERTASDTCDSALFKAAESAAEAPHKEAERVERLMTMAADAALAASDRPLRDLLGVPKLDEAWKVLAAARSWAFEPPKGTADDGAAVRAADLDKCARELNNALASLPATLLERAQQAIAPSTDDSRRTAFEEARLAAERLRGTWNTLSTTQRADLARSLEGTWCGPVGRRRGECRRSGGGTAARARTADTPECPDARFLEHADWPGRSRVDGSAAELPDLMLYRDQRHRHVRHQRLRDTRAVGRQQHVGNHDRSADGAAGRNWDAACRRLGDAADLTDAG